MQGKFYELIEKKKQIYTFSEKVPIQCNLLNMACVRNLFCLF